MANLNISVIEKRMMNEAEAANYCGLVPKHFKNCCPVQPVNLGGVARRYDKNDLDKWIDTEKSDEVHSSHDAILARLG